MSLYVSQRVIAIEKAVLNTTLVKKSNLTMDCFPVSSLIQWGVNTLVIKRHKTSLISILKANWSIRQLALGPCTYSGCTTHLTKQQRVDLHSWLDSCCGYNGSMVLCKQTVVWQFLHGITTESDSLDKLGVYGAYDSPLSFNKRNPKCCVCVYGTVCVRTYVDSA